MSPHKQAFTPKVQVRLPCVGCEKCGATDGLYSYQHGGIYLCHRCFFKTTGGKNWPTPKAMAGITKEK